MPDSDQHASTQQRRTDDQHYADWQGEQDTWASLNGIVRSDREFSLGALTGDARRARWGRPYQYPGADHPSYFRFNGRPAAISTEPYSASDFEELKAYVADHGLALHSPHDPRASFWAPGLTFLAIITARDFGPIRWLPRQRIRPGTPPKAGARHP